jgi:hypothetical protein
MGRLPAAAPFRGRRGTAQLNALSGSESDDAADRVVRGYANCDAVTWNDFDSEAAHPAAQLRQYFMARVALHAVQPARVNRNYGSLHVNQIVFAQSGVLLTEEMSGLAEPAKGSALEIPRALGWLPVSPGAFCAATRVPQHAAACKSRVFRS